MLFSQKLQFGIDFLVYHHHLLHLKTFSFLAVLGCDVADGFPQLQSRNGALQADKSMSEGECAGSR